LIIKVFSILFGKNGTMNGDTSGTSLEKGISRCQGQIWL
jgi:hypothetical protein